MSNKQLQVATSKVWICWWMSFSCISPSHTLAPIMVPHTICLWSLDTEMANTSIPVCLPTSWPSERRHRRIPSSPPHKRCLLLGWNTTAYTASEPTVSSTILWSCWIISIAQSPLGAATYRCSSMTSLLMLHGCRLSRVEERGGVQICSRNTFLILNMVSCLWRLFSFGSQLYDLVATTVNSLSCLVRCGAVSTTSLQSNSRHKYGT